MVSLPNNLFTTFGTLIDLLSNSLYYCAPITTRPTIVGEILQQGSCHNLNLRLATKARACKGAGQEGSLRVWENVKMNTHTPK